MDDRELERLIAKYEALVYTVVSGILTSRADREEAAADTFVSHWRDGRFDPDAPGAKSYIIQVAKRRAVDRLRRIPADMADIDETEPFAPADVFEEARRRENARLLSEEIRALDPTDGEIFTRFYYYAQSCTVIAKALGLRRFEVKRRLDAARETGRSRLLARNVIL